MKFFRFISSLFFIILILFPTMVGAFGSCDDAASCCESSIPIDEESDHDCMDLCFCSCCGNSVFFDVKEAKEFPALGYISSHQATFIYQSQFSFNFHADIWQPPRQV